MTTLPRIFFPATNPKRGNWIEACGGGGGMRAAIGFFVLCAFTATAQGQSRLCGAVARDIAAGFRAHPDALSLKSLAERTRALDFGAPASVEALRDVPLDAAERAQLANAVARRARAGGDKGLELIDSESGTAHCHTPLLFSLDSGARQRVAVPAPDDPFDRCGQGGVALGAVANKAFFLETDGGPDAAERLRIFAQHGDALAKPCSLTIRYRLEFAAAESFCAAPDLCRIAPKAAIWARAWCTGGAELRDPAFSPAAPPDALGADFPRPGGQARPAAPPLAFDAEQNFFGILGEPEADTLRIGAARQGPADPADREYLTLVALYKADRPVASFVVTRRRSAFESVAANPE